MAVEPRASSRPWWVAVGLILLSACDTYNPGTTTTPPLDGDEDRGGDGQIVGGDADSYRCSPTQPDGNCPPTPDGRPATCVDGTCRAVDSLEPCGPDHPQGFCPDDELCVDGLCEPPDETNSCSPEVPDGECGFGERCFAGVCFPVTGEDQCAPDQTDGICPPGERCASGTCVAIPPEERCSADNPEGDCDAWQTCEAGVCSAASPPDACAAEHPYGRCPSGEACTAGVCGVITADNVCSVDRPEGLCPFGDYCDAGYCLPLSGPDAPCTPANPEGACPPVDGCTGDTCGQTCVEGSCVPTLQLETCAPERPQGWCPADAICVDGVCEPPDETNLCSPAVPDGECEFGSRCFAGLCYPVVEADRCAPDNPVGLCPHGERCAAGSCEPIPPEDQCSPSRPDGDCDAWQSCVAGTCSDPVPPDACAPAEPVGRCPTGEACVEGTCEPITPDNACGPTRPAGLCPYSTECIDGYCQTIPGPTGDCSPSNPHGECPPPPRGCQGAGCATTCVDGVCIRDYELEPCGPARPDGYCPADLICVAGDCELPDEESFCSLDNPTGACGYGELCFDGICYPVDEAEHCSPANPMGICPADQYCNGGTCLDIPLDDRCSPTNPDGQCDAWEECINGACSTPEPPDTCAPERPHGRCPGDQVCADGVCETLTDENACSLANPTGLCPEDFECHSGTCEPTDGTFAPCGPDNPEGTCPNGMGCSSAGVCEQITPDNVCSWWNTTGLCPPGMSCNDWGECVIINFDEACSAQHPDGPCLNGATCVDGVCTNIACSIESPDGTCPNGLYCSAGDCLYPPCGPAVPYSGICPAGYVCSAGACVSLSGEPCSPTNLDGPCADPAQTCDDRAGSATLGSCVWTCGQAHPDGLCDPGLSCFSGWCLADCASGVVCGWSGVCCAAGEECPDAETCVPACPAPRVRCHDDQLCCDAGLECWAEQFCLAPCADEQRCGVSGELCCAADEVCSAELLCAPQCAPGQAACGVDLDLCCAAGESCLYDQCVPAGADCTDFLDCEYDEYCEPTLGACLPVDVAGGEVCQYERPPSIFDPLTEWSWTGVWPDCEPSFACLGGECALSCDLDSECVASCVDHRCACANDADCAAGSERCEQGACVVSGSSCGARYENVMSIPTVADLDADGYPEVIFRAYADSTLDQAVLVILDGRDGGDGTGIGSPPRAVLSPALDPTVPWLFAAGHQAAVNLDGDAALEIVAVAAQGLVAFNDPADFDPADGDGAVLWQTSAYPLDRTLDGGAPTVADLNGDGQAEVILGAVVLDGASGVILAAPAGGAELEGGGDRFDGGWISTVADVDLDGLPEVITGNRAWDVEESGGTWTMSPRWASVTAVPQPPGYTQTVDIPDGFSAVANFVVNASGPDTPEVVNVGGGNLYLLDGGTGTLLAGPIPVPAGAAGQNHGGPPTVADFDGDGQAEVAAAGSGCYSLYDFDCLAGYDPAARADVATLPGCAVAPDDRCGSYPSMVGVLWNYPAQDFSSACTGSSVFDFDGDGVDEVLYNDECFFRVFDGRDGTILMERPNSSRTNSEYPIVVDVDGDRNSEILLVANHDQVVRDHCASNHDANPDYAAYAHYDDLAGPGAYCDLTSFPEHTRECTVGAAGVTVFGDSSDQWVKTRPVWHQHAYHVTGIDIDPDTWVASLPAQEARSWEDSNTYRKNTRGAIPLNAPDIRVTSVVTDLIDCPTINVSARVANLGALGVDAGLPVSLYGLWEDPPVFLAPSATTAPLLPGSGEYVRFAYTPGPAVPAGPLSFRVVADFDGTQETLAECLETNNTADSQPVACEETIPVARCVITAPTNGDAEPLGTASFDGSFSYDPESSGGIAGWAWEVIDYPDGAWPGDFDPQGAGTAQYSIWLPIAGTYTVRLTVTDAAGRPSLETPDSICTIEAVPKSWIHVQLVWPTAVIDMDLHVVWWDNPSGNRNLYQAYDCYYADPVPDWFGSFPPNPRLDIDDTYGYGPENFNIDRPEAGRFRVYVNYAGNHYDFWDTPWVNSTVRIYLAEQLVAEYERELSYDFAHIWAIGDIIWYADDTYAFVPLPSDEPSDPSIVGYICDIFYDWTTDWWGTTCPTWD